jgi:hypothetical protein
MDRIDPEVPPLQKPTLEGKTDALFKANKLHERIRLFDDKGYYFVVVFQSQEQVLAFLEQMGWINEVGEITWIDGRVIAAIHNIKLPPVNEQLLHESYSKRKGSIKWPDGMKFFDETVPMEQKSVATQNES